MALLSLLKHVARAITAKIDAIALHTLGYTLSKPRIRPWGR